MRLVYQSQIGPGLASYSYGNTATTLELSKGETSESRALEALEIICASIGRQVPMGISLPPSPPPTTEEADRAQFMANPADGMYEYQRSLEIRLAAVEAKLDNVKAGVDRVETKIPKDAKP
jgi:hypothetical protein